MAFFRLVVFCLALGFLVVALRGVLDFLGFPRWLGSSKGKLSTKICLLGGLIPAWAGEPGRVSVQSTPVPVYPRVGGENLSYSGLLIVPERVYPRVGGGTKGLCASHHRRLGPIPAWAGEPQ